MLVTVQVLLKPVAVPEMQFTRVDGTSDALYAMELALQVCCAPSLVHANRLSQTCHLFRRLYLPCVFVPPEAWVHPDIPLLAPHDLSTRLGLAAGEVRLPKVEAVA